MASIRSGSLIGLYVIGTGCRCGLQGDGGGKEAVGVGLGGKRFAGLYEESRGGGGGGEEEGDDDCSGDNGGGG